MMDQMLLCLYQQDNREKKPDEQQRHATRQRYAAMHVSQPPKPVHPLQRIAPQ